MEAVHVLHVGAELWAGGSPCELRWGFSSSALGLIPRVQQALHPCAFHFMKVSLFHPRSGKAGVRQDREDSLSCLWIYRILFFSLLVPLLLDFFWVGFIPGAQIQLLSHMHASGHLSSSYASYSPSALEVQLYFCY